MATHLQLVISLEVLEEWSIRFTVSVPHPHIEKRGVKYPINHTTVPFIYKGISAYLKGLLAGTSAPSLRKFDVTLFNKFIFVFPLMSKFIGATVEFRFPVTKIHFNRDCFSISISDNHEEEAQGNRSLHVRVSCKPFDRQVSSAAQVCHKLCRWVTAAVEKLAIDGYEHAECRNEVDRRTWRELLSSFMNVKKLRVGRALASDLSRALQPTEEQPGTGGVMSVMFFLQELVLEEGCDHNAFKALTDERQHLGCPVRVVTFSRTGPRNWG